VDKSLSSVCDEAGTSIDDNVVVPSRLSDKWNIREASPEYRPDPISIFLAEGFGRVFVPNQNIDGQGLDAGLCAPDQVVEHGAPNIAGGSGEKDFDHRFRHGGVQIMLNGNEDKGLLSIDVSLYHRLQ